MEEYENSFFRLINSKPVIVNDCYTLSNGRISRYYFDLDCLSSAKDLEVLDRYLARKLIDFDDLRLPSFSGEKFIGVNKFKFNVIHGVTGKGSLIGRGLAVQLAREGIPFKYSYGRKTEKNHGRAEGYLGGYSFKKGDRILLFEDVLSTGSTLEKEIEQIQRKDVEIVGAYIIFDRLERREKNLSKDYLENKFGFKIYNAFDADRLIKELDEKSKWKNIIKDQVGMISVAENYNFYKIQGKEKLESAVKGVVSEIMGTEDLRPHMVLELVSQKTGVSSDRIKKRDRKKPVTMARMIAMYIYRNYFIDDGEPRFSYPRIERIFGRDHTTVMSGIKRIELILRD